jgi:acyl carrier protein
MSLEKVIAETFAVPEAAVADGLALSDIPTWDSLAHMMLIVRLEQDYAIEFSGDEIADLRSVGDIRATLQAHGVQP